VTSSRSPECFHVFHKAVAVNEETKRVHAVSLLDEYLSEDEAEDNQTSGEEQGSHPLVVSENEIHRLVTSPKAIGSRGRPDNHALFLIGTNNCPAMTKLRINS
jgi:hypothetical protein